MSKKKQLRRSRRILPIITHKSATTGQPREDSRRPHLWHRRRYNTALMKRKYVSHRTTGSAASCACDLRRVRWRLAEDGGASQAPLAPGAPTASHSHMEAFFLPQSCPVGFHKKRRPPHTPLLGLYSVSFINAGPRSGPIHTQQSGLNCIPAFWSKLCQQNIFLYIYTLSCLLEAELTVAEQLFTEFQSKHFVMVERCGGWSASSWTATPDSFDLLRLFLLKENPNNQGCLRILDFEGVKKSIPKKKFR